MTQTETTGSGGPQPNLSFNGNNQISNGGIVYDAAGNVKNDGSSTYTYDAEGNMTSSGTNTFTYDALNHRVRIDYPGYDSEEFVFNPSGQHTSAYSVNHGWAWAGWMFWGASPIATYINGTTQFEHQDWLGTERARTDVTGQDRRNIRFFAVWGRIDNGNG